MRCLNQSLPGKPVGSVIARSERNSIWFNSASRAAGTTSNRGSAREYYRIDRDPFERVNVFSRLSRRDRTSLHATLTALANCRGAAGCWAAAKPR